MFKKEERDLEEGKIVFETITGSVSRGTNIEGSDEDRKGIFIPHKEIFFSLKDYKETIVINEPEDREYHSLRKFMRLAAFKSNPTILEMLFIDDKFVTHEEDVIKILRNNRDLFLSQHCYYSFSGYAKDQLMRIKNAKLDVTKEDKQEHIDYVVNRVLRNVGERFEVFNTKGNRISLEEVLYLSNDKYNLKLNMNVRGGEIDQLYGMLNELRNVLQTYNKITGRNKKPNEGRLWKHAMQLVVLMKMGIEILKGDGLNVYREKDREELIRIREGKLSWKEFYEYVDILSNDLEYSKVNSVMPEKVNDVEVNKVYNEIMENYYY